MTTSPLPLILRPRIFEPWLEFSCGMTTAAVPHDPEAPRLELAAALPLLLDCADPLPVAVGEQVHGNRLVWIGYTAETPPPSESDVPDADDSVGRPSQRPGRTASSAQDSAPGADLANAPDRSASPVRFFGPGKHRLGPIAEGERRAQKPPEEGARKPAPDEEPEPSGEPGDEDRMLDPPEPGEVLEAPGVDGLLTLEPDLLLGVFTADCVPIVIADRHEKAFAVVHAGRKGTRLGIVRRAVEALVDAGSRVENLYAWVAPSISAPHYEVSPETAANFRDHFGHYPGAIQGSEHRHLALGLINWCELIASGLDRDHVELDARCTFSDARLFHSYRRDGADAGRMLTFAGFLGER